MTSAPEGRTAYLDADLREPEAILDHPDLHATLDLAQPVGLMLMAILHFIVDDDDPYGIVARLLDPLPSGSFLTISHFTTDFLPPETAAMITAAWERNPNNGQGRARSAEELGRFFQGLDLVPPGIAPLAQWRAEAEPQPRPSSSDIAGYGRSGASPEPTAGASRGLTGGGEPVAPTPRPRPVPRFRVGSPRFPLTARRTTTRLVALPVVALLTR